jgi:hypothetical protein
MGKAHQCQNKKFSKMKAIKAGLFIFIILFSNLLLSQNKESKFANTVNKVDNITEQSNQKIEQVNLVVKSTLDSTKKTFNDLKSLFNINKNKSLKSVLITINDIEYSNPKLIMLTKAISKVKGVKKSSKSFANNMATIKVIYKKNADNLWKNIPENISNQFKVKSINTQEISITPNR